MDPEEKAIEVYRSLMADELARPEVARDKKLFMARFFEPAPVLVPEGGAFAASLALAGLFLFFLYIAPGLGVRPVKNLQPVMASSASAVSQETAPVSRIEVTDPSVKKKKRFFRIPRIWVKRAVSQVGQPMVYQKKVDEVPVTIVWVFTPPPQTLNKTPQPGMPT